MSLQNHLSEYRESRNKNGRITLDCIMVALKEEGPLFATQLRAAVTKKLEASFPTYGVREGLIVNDKTFYRILKDLVDIGIIKHTSERYNKKKDSGKLYSKYSLRYDITGVENGQFSSLKLSFDKWNEGFMIERIKNSSFNEGQGTILFHHGDDIEARGSLRKELALALIEEGISILKEIGQERNVRAFVIARYCQPGTFDYPGEMLPILERVSTGPGGVTDVTFREIYEPLNKKISALNRQLKEMDKK